MELYQLRYFSYAAKCENISEASRRLMVAQSSVSKAITGLEAELQTDLFIRNGKHIRLSSSGRLFAAKVAPILSAVDALPETFSSEKENAVRLRVLSASALIPDILPGSGRLNPRPVSIFCSPPAARRRISPSSPLRTRLPIWGPCF